MRKLNLITHCGSNRVDLAQIAAVQTPTPKDRWFPIPHIQVVETVQNQLAALGMEVVEQQHALARDGARYFGLMQVAARTPIAVEGRPVTSELPQTDKTISGIEGLANGNDYAYVLGLRNSHDKMFPAALVVGSGVLVCDNLAFSGEIQIARRHTTNINRDFPGLVGQAVGQLQSKWFDTDRRFQAYQEHELTDERAHDLVIRALDVGAVTVTQIPDVLQQWRQPAYPEFTERRDAWRLFNAFTQIGKQNNIFAVPKRTQALTALLDVDCGLVRHLN